MAVCGKCGHENPEGFRFCVACGTPAAEPAPPREQRKTLTILFCDVAGSTALGERLDPEALRRVMRRYFGEMSAVVERHGGTVEKFIGDAVMAVFGVPHVRCVRASLIQGFAYEVLLEVAPDDAQARERMLECFRIKGYRPGLQAYS